MTANKQQKWIRGEVRHWCSEWEAVCVCAWRARVKGKRRRKTVFFLHLSLFNKTLPFSTAVSRQTGIVLQ